MCCLKKEASHTFFVVEDEDYSPDPESFPLKMLCGGIVPGIPKCSLRNIDGNCSLWYEVTANQTLPATYESRKLTFPEVRFILEGCIGMIEEMEEYLLPADMLLLSPEHIFVNPERTRMLFCCLPGGVRDIREQLTGMAEYLIGGIDPGDRKALAAGYGFYRRVFDSCVPMDQLRKAIYEAVPETEEAKREAPPKDPGKALEYKVTGDPGPWDEEFVREGYIRGNPEKEEPGMKRYLVSASAAASCAVLLILAGLMLHKGGASLAAPLEYLMGALAVCMGAGCLIFRIIKTGKQKRRVRKEDQYVNVNMEEEPDEADGNFYDGGSFTDLSGFHGYEPADSVFTEVSLPPGQEKKKQLALVPELSRYPVIFPEKGITVIGSLPGAADVVLKSPAVSRIHAKLLKVNGSLSIADLHSRNGTYLNGRAVREEENKLHAGDQITFADVRYSCGMQEA